MVEYYLLSEKEVLEELKASDKGLSSEEAASRLKIYGPNKIREAPHTGPILIFLSQFKSPIVWILLAAMLISLFVKEYVDFSVIGVIVILNSILGFVQEYRAGCAIDALKKMISLKATVLRDGQEKEIDAEEVVLGDILLLDTGDKIPADARLLESVNLQTQEASLTGESVPVKKAVFVVRKEVAVADRVNMVFSSTVVTNGHARAVVTGTGMNSEIGRIATLIEEAEPEPTPLQKTLKKLSVYIGLMVIAIAVLVFIVGLIKMDQPIESILLTAIALAVAAIPEGLPAIVTVGLSMGVQNMAKKNALVRNLPSVETLGACSVICSDKTGTLTHNEMTVRKLYVNRKVIEVAGSGYSPEGYFSEDSKPFEFLLKIGALNNNAKLKLENSAWQVFGDPTEAALLVSAKKAKLDVENLHDEYERVGEIEFTSERKRMTTLHMVKKVKFAFTKGAPEIVLGLCSKVLVNGRVERLNKDEKGKIFVQNDKFAKDALRVLGFAYKELSGIDAKGDPEKEMVFVGLQAMIDPPRREAKDAIEKCKTAGIRVVMITGDNVATAEAVAKELGIEGRAITGLELDQIENLASEVDNIGVYARVNPAHKLKIVEALKARGHMIVAMTGDGVNDAPALKKSDLGIAMGITGTDVAKEASAMILADDNFASIVRAVEEGRRIYDNIRKYLAYLIGCNIGEVLVILTSILLGLPLPLIAIQILWVNLVTDGLPAIALSVDPAEPGVMQRPPRKQDDGIFKGIEHYVFIFPLVMTIATIWLFDQYLTVSLVKAQTVAFTSLVMFELFAAISCRSLHKPIFVVGAFKNVWLWLAVLSSVGLQLLIMYVPFLQKIFRLTALSFGEWGLILGVAFVGFAYLEIHKLVAGR
ncbi:Copper-exporting P-type ATPase B [uncultured archaeon]|nr:Copper-exporting P-type ATPase B [uncultured archaeon]